ncbi:hypothetical protein L6452_37924 [Arctium lappa]|uniref:Uncharacterized protein n=1 Tax=Arctium lappa TaxID=4217 RepID=A0ACB8Y4E8_ARCLA|nr:hypothetical protein L6452_37924 [Arctium lappa]
MASSKSSNTSKNTPLTQETLAFPACNQLARLSVDVSASILTIVEHPDLTFGVEDVRKVLKLPIYQPYTPFPTGREHEEVITAMHYSHDGKGKGSGTLLRKNMGVIWNFFFSHLIYCISHKTYGWDQCPAFITRLAHALIFMRRVDFAQVIFDSIVPAISPPRTHNVALPRFLSLIINEKLAGPLRADADLLEPTVVFDLPYTQISKQTLHKPLKATDTPLPVGMISLITSPNLIWGSPLETGTERSPLSQGPSQSVAPFPPKSSRAKTVATKKKTKKATAAALASMTLTPKKPSESTPVIAPSPQKREGSKSPPKSRSKRLRKSFSTEPHTPSTDSPRSTEVEIPPLGPRGSVKPQITSSTPSQKGQCFSSSHHSLTPGVTPDDSAQLHEELIFLGFPPKRQPLPPLCILPHDPPSPITERAGSLAPPPFMSNSQQSHFSLPSDVLADIIDTNRQQRLLGSQFETLRKSIRDPELLDSLDINNNSLVELLRLIKKQNTELLRVNSDFYRCMDDMEQDIQGLRNPLSDALDAILKKVIKLIDNNTSLTLFMVALKAASDTCDQEVAQLQQRATDQGHINSQLLDAISTFNAKLATLSNDVAQCCVDSLDIDITDSAFTPNDHRTLHRLDLRIGRVSAKAGLSSPARPEGEKPSEGEHITPQINLSGARREGTSKDSASKGEETDVEMKVSASAKNVEKEKGSVASDKEKGTDDTLVIEGEETDHSVKVIEESKGEIEPRKDKGKKKLTPEEAAAEDKRLKSIKIKQLVDEGGIKLLPPLKTVSSDLGLSEEEIRVAKIVQMTLYRDSELAQKLAGEEVEKAKGSTDLVVAQLSALEESTKKKDETKLCASIGIIRLSATDVVLEKSLMSVDRLDSLVWHGVTEWIEIMLCLEKSRSALNPNVEKYITDLQMKFSEYRNTYKIIHTPAEEKLIKRKVPDVSNLDLSIPTLVSHPSTTVLSESIEGIFFNDTFGEIRFFRSREIPIVDTTFLVGIAQIIPIQAKDLYEVVTDEMKKRSAAS